MDIQLSAFFASYDSAWNQRDAEAFTGHFLENASAIFFMLDGKKSALNSRAEMLTFYIPSFQSLQARPTVAHKTEIDRTQNITPDLMLVDGDALITEQNAEGQNAVVRKWAVSFLLTKTELGWKVFSLRASDRPLT